MKIIDLLNKIANGEEVPKKVFYKTGAEYTGGYYWNYDESFRDYKDKAGDYVFNAGNYHIIDMLNMEVKILEEEPYVEICGRWFTKSEYDEFVKDEEEKKIPEKLDLILDEQFTNDELQAYIYETQVKLNQVIDYLKSKGE